MKFPLKIRYTLAILALVFGIVTLLASVLLVNFHQQAGKMSQTTAQEMKQRLLVKMHQRGQTMTQFLADSLINPVYDYDIQAIYELAVTTLKQEDVIYF